MCLNSVHNLSEIEVIDDLALFRRAILGDGTLLPNGSQGWIDPISPYLAKTSGDHFYRRNSFQSSDMLLHFQRRAAEI